jgi:MFS family permease
MPPALDTRASYSVDAATLPQNRDTPVTPTKTTNTVASNYLPKPVERVGTFAALRNPNFRLYFIGQLISTSGTWTQNVAQGYLVFQLTKSEWWVGVIACAVGLPMLFISPYAGVIVEHFPRRRVLMVTQVIQMVLAFILTALVLTNTIQIWHIVGLALVLGVTTAFDAPARQTFISDLVGRELLPSGIALNSVIVNGSRVFGPTLAGLLLVLLNVTWCFFLNGISFLFVIFMLALVKPPALDRPDKRPGAFTQIREGLGYVRHNSVVLPLLLLSSVGGILCWSVISQFPAFADEVMHSPENGLALLSAANGVGAVITALTISSLARRFGYGRILTIVTVATSVFIILLSQTTNLVTGALASAAMGFAVIAYFVTINTTIQLNIPDQYRGRVLSLYTLTIIGLNPFGALVLGALAEWLRTPSAMLIYGVLFGIASIAILIKFPQVRRI